MRKGHSNGPRPLPPASGDVARFAPVWDPPAALGRADTVVGRLAGDPDTARDYAIS
jgi:hypothetical protein